MKVFFLPSEISPNFYRTEIVNFILFIRPKKNYQIEKSFIVSECRIVNVINIEKPNIVKEIYPVPPPLHNIEHHVSISKT